VVTVLLELMLGNYIVPQLFCEGCVGVWIWLATMSVPNKMKVLRTEDYALGHQHTPCYKWGNSRCKKSITRIL